MKVIIQLEDAVKYIDNVSKIETILAFDMFDNEIKIRQGERETVFKQYEIYGFEVEED